MQAMKQEKDAHRNQELQHEIDADTNEVRYKNAFRNLSLEVKKRISDSKSFYDRAPL